MVRLFFGITALALTALLVMACSGTDGVADFGDSGNPNVSPDGASLPSTCTNGARDGDEIGIDCGGSCKKCAGDPCATATDCTNGCTDGKCNPPPGKKCGVGEAALCADGDACQLDADCTSDVCNGATCAAATDAAHSDGRRDAGETGIDCGGSVKATKLCPEGQGCKGTGDCLGACLPTGLCGPVDATDGKKDNGETDIDCGGPNAPACADGKSCLVMGDCANGYCTPALVCATATNSDGAKNGTETDIDCGGGAPTNAPRCATGKTCAVTADCDLVLCTLGVCASPANNDGIKNGTETDIDCGGGAPTNAPRCATTKACLIDGDCAGTVRCTGLVCQPPTATDGLLNGTESDVDCGGGAPTNAPRCAEGKICAVDGDCKGACSYQNTCVDAPSCKKHYGGDTCGSGEVGEAWANHESCCRTLRVAGYVDPNQPGKQVYVDKYEVTAGRMRAFLETLGGGVDGLGNAKDANVKAWMAAHRPARWNVGWENMLPSANAGSITNYTVKRPTVDLLYPGEDQYLLNHYTQSTWWIGTAAGAQAVGQDMVMAADMGIYAALGNDHFFHEYYSNPAIWGSTDYASGHAFNCWNGAGSYAWSTYWFDPSKLGGASKANPKDFMDVKALTCSPFALYAAFCAWDGGQLMTGEVSDFITNNTIEPVYSTSYQNGKLAPGASQCAGNTLNTYPDGTSPCYNVYYYGNGNTADDSARIAPPGRVAADVMRINPADEPWMDMIGNLEEAVFKKGETARFDYRGFGAEYSSITHHKNQQTTPRMKAGAFGARCMRFK